MMTQISQTPTWPGGTMGALAFTAQGQLDRVEVARPEAEPGRVLIRVAILGLCGTDVHLMDGSSPYVTNGLTDYPIRFGHEWAGEVVAVGSGVSDILIGSRVVGEPFMSCGQCLTCRAGRYELCPSRSELGVRGDVPGAAAEYLSIPVTNVHVVPHEVPIEHSLLAEPSITVLHAFETGAVQPGETVAVLGTGTIGLIAVQVAAGMHCPVDVIGIDPAGLELAKKLGARNTFRPEEAPDHTYPVVMEATGAAAIGPTLTRIAGVGARLLQLGIPNRPVESLDLGVFVGKGLSLHGILGGVHLVPRALQLIAAGVIRPAELIDRIVPVEPVDGVRDAFDDVRKGGRGRPKVLVDVTTFATNATP